MDTDLNIKIERNIPIPPRGSSRSSQLYAAFDQLDVGDSFAIQATVKPPKHVQQRVTGWQQRSKPKRLATRVLKTASGEKYIRVWRIV